MHCNSTLCIILLLKAFCTVYGFRYYSPAPSRFTNIKVDVLRTATVSQYRQSTSSLSSASSITENSKLPKLPKAYLQHLPNILTVTRVVAILPFVTFFVQDQKTVASGIYALACLTDLFDGWFARKFNVISKFGAFLDPVADKVIKLHIV